MIEKTLQSCPMRICCYRLMPNHRHFVVWPEQDGDLARFMQELSVTYVRNWVDPVNQPLMEAELKAILRCVNKGQPYGSDKWIEATARKLGLESTMRRRGRPSKVRRSK